MPCVLIPLVVVAEALMASVHLVNAVKKNEFFLVNLHFAPFLLNAAMFNMGRTVDMSADKALVCYLKCATDRQASLFLRAVNSSLYICYVTDPERGCQP